MSSSRPATPSIHADGRFSLGFPRRDGGEEINARIRIIRRPLADLRHAFGIDDYDVDGVAVRRVPRLRRLPAAVRLRAHGDRRRRRLRRAVRHRPARACGSRATGVRLDNIADRQGRRARHRRRLRRLETAPTRSTSTARGIPVESVALAQSGTRCRSRACSTSPPAAAARSTRRATTCAARSATSSSADEGIGQVVGDININGDLMTLKLEAASPRLAVSGAGRIALTPEMDAELSFSVADTSLDPVRPRVRAAALAVHHGDRERQRPRRRRAGQHRSPAGGGHGRPARPPPLRLPAAQRGADPHRARSALGPREPRCGWSARTRSSTSPASSSLHDERIAVRANGDANLGILQGFVPNIRSSGRAALQATFEGPMRDPHRHRHDDASRTAASAISICRTRSRTSRVRCGSTRAASRSTR